MKYTIGIQPDLLPENSFSDRWIPRLETMGHDVRELMVTDRDFLERVNECDGFLWWFPPLPRPRDVGKRLLQALDHAGKVFVHPDARSCWHFDDKVAQALLLQAGGIPTPKTWLFWRYDHAMAFLRDAQFPLVVKLAAGVRSTNVALLGDAKEAERIARRMFGSGVETLGPRRFSALRAASRPLRSAVQMRVAGVPLPRPEVHRGYMLVQEFVAGNDFDTRVNVIGNRAFAFRRPNRPNDFRASGSHNPDLDPSKIALDAIRLGFETSKKLRMPILCFDILRRMDEPVITEISYYFNAATIAQCPGHWRMRGDELEWVDGSLRAEDAVLEDFLERLSSFRNKS